MKYTLHVQTEIRRQVSKWYFRLECFVLHESKVDAEFQPHYFDTIEAARSRAYEFFKNSYKYQFIYLCDSEGNLIETIERK